MLCVRPPLLSEGIVSCALGPLPPILSEGEGIVRLASGHLAFSEGGGILRLATHLNPPPCEAGELSLYRSGLAALPPSPLLVSGFGQCFD